MRALGSEGDIGFVGREDLGEPAPPAPPPPGKPTTGSMTGLIFVLCMAAAALGYVVVKAARAYAKQKKRMKFESIAAGFVAKKSESSRRSRDKQKGKFKQLARRDEEDSWAGRGLAPADEEYDEEAADEDDDAVFGGGDGGGGQRRRGTAEDEDEDEGESEGTLEFGEEEGEEEEVEEGEEEEDDDFDEGFDGAPLHLDGDQRAPGGGVSARCGAYADSFVGTSCRDDMTEIGPDDSVSNVGHRPCVIKAARAHSQMQMRRDGGGAAAAARRGKTGSFMSLGDLGGARSLSARAARRQRASHEPPPTRHVSSPPLLTAAAKALTALPSKRQPPPLPAVAENVLLHGASAAAPPPPAARGGAPRGGRAPQTAAAQPKPPKRRSARAAEAPPPSAPAASPPRGSGGRRSSGGRPPPPPPAADAAESVLTFAEKREPSVMTLQPPAPRGAPRHAPPLRTPLAGAGVDRADASESALSFGGEDASTRYSQGHTDRADAPGDARGRPPRQSARPPPAADDAESALTFAEPPPPRAVVRPATSGCACGAGTRAATSGRAHPPLTAAALAARGAECDDANGGGGAGASGAVRVVSRRCRAPAPPQKIAFPGEERMARPPPPDASEDVFTMVGLAKKPGGLHR